MYKRKPLFVVIPRYGAGVGGVTSHVETLIEMLKGRGNEVAYWFPPQPGLVSKAGLVLAAGFNLSKARQGSIKQKQRRIKSWLDQLVIPRNYKAIIHTHDVLAAKAALEYGRLPIIHTVHGPGSREILMDFGDAKTADFIRQIETEVYQKVNGLIAVDQEQASILEEDFGVQKNRIKVIHNAVNSSEAIRKATALKNHTLVREMASEQAVGKRIIFIPRRLVEKNGVHYAIRSLPLLPESYVFWISGDGPFAEPIRDFSVKNGIQQRVRMLGAQPNEIVLALMHQANIVLVPSIPVHGIIEATSIAALEAMALGKPLVASRIGGLAEMIQDRITGLLYEPGSLDELVSALLTLEDEAFAIQVGSNAQKYVRESWSLDRWGDTVLEQYMAVLTSAV